ncbi:MAG TPA: hypothetical protein VF503_14560 [Sphingobium sp.]|uniref:hypothetical protein n=1 Tax=Sphingobium sp. TaxID=1912891 RepID=UPI002ED1266B
MPTSYGYLLPDFSAISGPSEAVSPAENSQLFPDRINGHLARLESADLNGFAWDAELPGFGLRFYATGKKCWIAQLRQRGNT